MISVRFHPIVSIIMSKRHGDMVDELLRRGSARSRLLGLNNARAEMREWIKTISRKRQVSLRKSSQYFATVCIDVKSLFKYLRFIVHPCYEQWSPISLPKPRNLV